MIHPQKATRNTLLSGAAATRARLATGTGRAAASAQNTAAAVGQTARRALVAGWVGAALMSGGFAGTAQAAIISGTYAFSASDFQNNPGFGGAAGLAGSFTLSFDNSADIVDSTALTVNSLTLNGVPTALFGQIGFRYTQLGDRLNIGGVAGLLGAEGVQVGMDVYDFSLRFQPVSGPNGPAFFSLLVGTGNGTTDRGLLDPQFTEIRNLSATFTPAENRVPVPSTLALAGLGAVALTLARRRGAAGSR
jgi:hypothetical protein